MFNLLGQYGYYRSELKMTNKFNERGSNNLKDAGEIVEEAQKLRANLNRDTSSFLENMKYSK